MLRSITLSSFLLLFLILAVSCSNGNTQPTAPMQEGKDSAANAYGSTTCLGFWQVTIDKETGTINAVDMRSSDLILNVLGFLEPPALKGLTIEFGTLKINDPIIEVDVVLTHPIPDPVFMGFDVRGVVFGPKVANADGLTIIPGPEFFTGVPFGYQNGLLGTPDSVAHYTGLAGYKYFCDGLGKDADLAAFMSNPTNLEKRGVFSQGPNKNTRHYVLDWTGSSQGFFVFNYAVYANYNWPVGDPPIDISDFEITAANSAEAFCCRVTELANNLYFTVDSGAGGSISLEAEVWDWQVNVADVTIESVEPGVIDTAEYDYDNPGTVNKSHIYGFADVPGTPTSTGPLEILITATDPMTFGECWFMAMLNPSKTMYSKNVYNCFIYTADVSACPIPVIAEIDPWYATQGAIVDDATITGSGFIDGTSKDVRLTMTGQAPILATDVQFIDSTTVTADFNLTGAKIGGWDVEVTNGCGEKGTEVEGFWVIDPNCPTPVIYGINPYEGFQGEIVHVVITGNYFDAGPLKEVRLTNAPSGQGSKEDIICDITDYGQNTIEADFDITTAAIGVWTVRVTNGCGKSVEKGPAQGGGFRVWCPVPTVDPDGINPDEGEQDTTVTVVFTGNNFMPDNITPPESARFHKNGVWIDGVIDAVDCTNNILVADFYIPADAEVGLWDIYLRNSCGTGDSFPIYEGFRVKGCNPPELNEWDSIVPGNVNDGPDFHAEINGAKLFEGDYDFIVTLVSADGTYIIDATNESWISDNKIECDLSIPGDAPYGYYTLHVINGCGMEGMRDEAFNVYPVVTEVEPPSGQQGSTVGITLSGWLFHSDYSYVGIARIEGWVPVEIVYGFNDKFVDSTTVIFDADLTGATISPDWIGGIIYGVDGYGGGSFEVMPP